MRRSLIGSTIIAVLLVVLALTADPGVTGNARPQPSEVGIEAPDEPPFEFGSVNDSQSFR